MPVKNLRHLVEVHLIFFSKTFSFALTSWQLVEANAAPFLRLDLESERVIVLDAVEASVQSAEILESNNIPYIKSADLRKHSPSSPIPTKPLAEVLL